MVSASKMLLVPILCSTPDEVSLFFFFLSIKYLFMVFGPHLVVLGGWMGHCPGTLQCLESVGSLTYKAYALDHSTFSLAQEYFFSILITCLFGATPGGAQELFMILCSGETLSRAETGSNWASCIWVRCPLRMSLQAWTNVSTNSKETQGIRSRMPYW